MRRNVTFKRGLLNYAVAFKRGPRSSLSAPDKLCRVLGTEDGLLERSFSPLQRRITVTTETASN